MAFSLINSGRRLIERINTDNVVNTAIGAATGYVDPVDQPQLAYMWEVSFRGMFASKAENLVFYARSTSIPSITIEPIKRYYAGVEYGVSGKDNTPKVFTITFWDNQDLEVYRYFMQWMNTQNDMYLGRKVNPMNYKRDISLKLKDTSDLLINGEFIFRNAFPTELGEISLAYDESNVMSFDVVFRFDSREMTGEMNSVVQYGINAAGEAIGGVVSSAIEGLRRWW